jgi:hypothetical protein
MPSACLTSEGLGRVACWRPVCQATEGKTFRTAFPMTMTAWFAFSYARPARRLLGAVALVLRGCGGDGPSGPRADPITLSFAAPDPAAVSDGSASGTASYQWRRRSRSRRMAAARGGSAVGRYVVSRARRVGGLSPVVRLYVCRSFLGGNASSPRPDGDQSKRGFRLERADAHHEPVPVSRAAP